MALRPIVKPVVKRKMHPAAERTPKSRKAIGGHDTAKPRRAKTRQRVRQSRLARNHPEKIRASSMSEFAGS